MIISIWKKQDLSLVNELPTEVLSAIETTIEILDENYGTERTAEDLGGYIAVVDKVGIEELKQHQLKGILPEHIDKIHGTDYISVLFLCSSDFSIVVICKKELKDLIESLNVDHSHITKKIRQILAYIIYGTFDFNDTFQSFDIKSISDKIEHIISQKQNHIDDSSKKQLILSVDDLVPPPIYDVNIELEDNKDNTPILFETLSSGERQQTYSISALLYHLSNLESVWQDSHKQRVAYRHVNVIMEEIELYFHPELQRTYIKNVLDGIKQLQLHHIESINICFVTHSPFILSDILSRNILALKIEDDHVNVTSKHMSTFGANIHDMLKNSFFLKDGPIGAYADSVIRDIIEKMERFSKEHINVDMLKIHEKIMLIDEPIIRMALLDEFHRVSHDNNTELKIKELERQIQELENKK